MASQRISALAQVVDLLPQLSEQELGQLAALVCARSGFTASSVSSAPRGITTKGPVAKRGAARSSGAGGNPPALGARKRGNPARKSQWATNPLYQEYSRLKKVVEAQAKAQKLSFNRVSSAEKTAYDAAFTAWMKEKSSFRNRGETSVTGSVDAMSADEETPEPAGTAGDSEDTGKSGEVQGLRPGESWADVTEGLRENLGALTTQRAAAKPKRAAAESVAGKPPAQKPKALGSGASGRK